MNFLEKILLAIGLKSTERWVGSHDAMPADGDLALAETLGSKTTRAALMMILISLAHGFFLWRSGTLTSEAFMSHAEWLVYGLAIVFGRHALTKFNLDGVRDQINAAIKGLVFVLGSGFLILGFTGTASAQTVTNAAAVVSNQTTSITTPLWSAASAIFSNSETYAGIGTTFGWEYGEDLAQQVNVIGIGSSNAWLHAGIEHNTLFAQDKNHEQLGVGLSAHWDAAPKFLHVLLLNANNVTIQAGFDADTEVFSSGRTHADNFGAHLSIGRPLP